MFMVFQPCPRFSQQNSNDFMSPHVSLPGSSPQMFRCPGHVDRAQAKAAAGFIHGADLSVGHASDGHRVGHGAETHRK